MSATDPRLCPLRLVAIASDPKDRLVKVGVGVHCPEGWECAWWDEEHDKCILFSLVRQLEIIGRSRYK